MQLQFAVATQQTFLKVIISQSWHKILVWWLCLAPPWKVLSMLKDLSGAFISKEFQEEKRQEIFIVSRVRKSICFQFITIVKVGSLKQSENPVVISEIILPATSLANSFKLLSNNRNPN